MQLVYMSGAGTHNSNFPAGFHNCSCCHQDKCGAQMSTSGTLLQQDLWLMPRLQCAQEGLPPR